MTTTDRPAPGKVGGTAADDAYKPYALSRDGDTTGAIIALLERRQARAANQLHYRLRELNVDFDGAAKRMEDGKRAYVISNSNHLSDIPTLVELLNEATDVLEEARVFASPDREPTITVTTFHMDRTAELLDRYIEQIGLAGSHPLSVDLRKNAKKMRADEAAKLKAASDIREAKAELDREKRVSRPLGKLERSHLLKISSFGPVRRGALHGTKLKAAESLVERDLLKLVDKPSGAQYELTATGRAVADTVSAAR